MTPTLVGHAMQAQPLIDRNPVGSKLPARKQQVAQLNSTNFGSKSPFSFFFYPFLQSNPTSLFPSNPSNM
jgi:hypothetical protein